MIALWRDSICLWQVLRYVWNNLPAGFPLKLQDSEPKRTDAVFKVKGGHDKY